VPLPSTPNKTKPQHQTQWQLKPKKKTTKKPTTGSVPQNPKQANSKHAQSIKGREKECTGVINSQTHSLNNKSSIL